MPSVLLFGSFYFRRVLVLIVFDYVLSQLANIRIGKNVFYVNEIKKILKGTSIMVIRWDGNKLKSSKPCMHCCLYMKMLGIKKVIYSDDNGELIEEKITNIESSHVCLSRRCLKKVKGI
jgi:hypothetical protein